MIIVLATIMAKPGNRPALEALAAECASETRKEAGCLSYELLVSFEDENKAVFTERWKDMDAFQAHLKTRHFLKFMSGAKNLVAQAPETKLFEASEFQV